MALPAGSKRWEGPPPPLSARSAASSDIQSPPATSSDASFLPSIAHQSHLRSISNGVRDHAVGMQSQLYSNALENGESSRSSGTFADKRPSARGLPGLSLQAMSDGLGGDGYGMTGDAASYLTALISPSQIDVSDITRGPVDMDGIKKQSDMPPMPSFARTSSLAESAHARTGSSPSRRPLGAPHLDADSNLARPSSSGAVPAIDESLTKTRASVIAPFDDEPTAQQLARQESSGNLAGVGGGRKGTRLGSAASIQDSRGTSPRRHGSLADMLGVAPSKGRSNVSGRDYQTGARPLPCSLPQSFFLQEILAEPDFSSSISSIAPFSDDSQDMSPSPMMPPHTPPAASRSIFHKSSSSGTGLAHSSSFYNSATGSSSPASSMPGQMASFNTSAGPSASASTFSLHQPPTPNEKSKKHKIGFGFFKKKSSKDIREGNNDGECRTRFFICTSTPLNTFRV